MVLGCQAVGVRTYGQYCPIARASELLAERWSLIILRNIVLIGCRTFNQIADGAPGLSRGLLSKRLRELERAGVIEIRPKAGGPGSTYAPTQAGRELSEVMLALQRWGAQWAELTPADNGASTEVPGLSFCGVHFLRTRKSSVLFGVGEDAAIVAQAIATHQPVTAAHRPTQRLNEQERPRCTRW
jgi:DNA-binding HxlR family transcriptional regulator